MLALEKNTEKSWICHSNHFVASFEIATMQAVLEGRQQPLEFEAILADLLNDHLGAKILLPTEN